jgi:hypothetical protein
MARAGEGPHDRPQEKQSDHDDRRCEGEREVLHLEHAREIAGAADDEDDGRGIDPHDRGTTPPFGSRADISQHSADEQNPTGDGADLGEPVLIHEAEIVQLASLGIDEADAEQVGDRQARPGRRRPDGDRCQHQDDRKDDPDIGDQPANDDGNSGEQIAHAGGDQIIGVVADVPDGGGIADLVRGRGAARGPLPEHETPRDRHGRAERGADIAAAGDRREVVDPPEQIVMV